MDFMFLSVPQNAESYLHEKFLDDPANLEQQEKIKRLIENTKTNTDMPQIASESDFFNVDRAQMKMIEIAKRCAIQSLAVQYPLNAGEEIEADLFSYLTAPWSDFPAFTGVLKRKTNMAEILYFFELVRIGEDGITYLLPAQPEEALPPPRGISMSVVSTFIQKALAKAGPQIGSAIAEKLGAVVMKLVMKELFGVEDDATQIINEVKKIVKEEIEENEIARVEGTINGTVQYITGEYYNKKQRADLKNRDVRQKLSSELWGFSQKFYTDVTGLLRTAKYDEKGLKVFAFGATVHLLLIQEMALVDPDDMNPNQSSYLATLRNNATTYKSHVQRVYQSVMSARNNFGVICEETYSESGGKFRKSEQWYWKDNYLNQKHGPFGPSKDPDRSPEQNAHDDMERARARALAEKREQLGDPEASFLSVIDGLVHFQGFSQ